MATQPGSFGFSFGGKSSGSGFAGFPDTNALYKTHKSRTKAASKPPHVGGLLGAYLGISKNLIDDVKDAALGLPMGLVQTFKDPVGVLKETANSTWHTWSPLFEGDVGKFAHQFYDHPLAPILDIASVLTGGAAAVGKGASVGVAAGSLSKTSRLGKMASGSRDIAHGKFRLNHDTMAWERVQGVPEYVKATSANPLVRAFQLKKADIYNSLAGEVPKWKFSPDSPIIGANKRYRKRELTKTWHKHAAMNTQIAAMLQAAKFLETKGPEGDVGRLNILRTLHNNMLRHSETIHPTHNVTGDYAYVADFAHIPLLNRNKGVPGGMAFQDNLKNVGNTFTTTDVHKAARSADGQLLIVPKHTAKMLGIEAKNSTTALKWLYHKPTQVWKYAVLAARPAFLVNNAVGNYFMYTMSYGGSKAMRGYVDALRQVHGDYRVAKDLSKTERWFKNMTDPTGHGWMDRHFLDQLTNSFADASYGLEGKVAAAQLAGSKLRYGLYPITHAIADRFLRRAAINAQMRNLPEVKAHMKTGLSYDEAANRTLIENPNIRNRISEKVNDTLGDYHTLNKGERVLRDLVPFYTWDRAIVRHGGAMLRDRPIAVAAMTRIGQSGTAATEEALGGAIPGFLRGVVPIGSGGPVPGSKGRRPILTTGGLNPYATLGELAGFAEGVAGGRLIPSETLSPVNPLITGGLGALMGVDPKTGARIEKRVGVPLPFDIALNQIQGLPQARLAAQALPEQGFGWDQIRKLIGDKQKSTYTRKGSKKTQDALYSKSWQEIAAAYLGVPVKQVSIPAAKKRAGAETKALEAQGVF